MPINNEHYTVYEIKGNPIIQRYMSLEKFLSLLHRRSLFFTRLDKLEDPFEGSSPKIVRNGLRRFLEARNKDFFTKIMSDEDIDKDILNFEKHVELTRALYTVNCWHIRESENALMWKSYSNNNYGIMIQSSYNSIVKSLNDSPENIQTSLVRYYNYEKDSTIPFGNGMHPVIHKRHFYSDEAEIRLVHQVSQTSWVHDWENEECQEGIYIKTDIGELIQEIKVAPFAPNWFLEIVQSVCDKYDLKAPVSKSLISH